MTGAQAQQHLTSPVPVYKAGFPERFDFLRQPARYKVAYGGRGSAKSWSFAAQLLLLGMERKIRVLCTRELQTSIADSVHKLLSDRVADLDKAGHYRVLTKGIYGANGTEFVFEGVRNNVTKLKSLEGVDVCWVEEAEKVSDASWDVLIPTIRKPDSEIWITFNPDLETDPTYQRFVINPPPAAVVRKINWSQNPWFPEVLNRERRYKQRVDPEGYANIWEGECRQHNNAAILAGKWRVDAFQPKPDWDGPYYGADWGFSQDPTVLVRMWIDGRRLLIEHEAYGVGVELDSLPEMFDRVPESRIHTIRADSARPETISHLSGKGFNIQGAAKWSGSVEDGVEYLRSFEEIVIHERCKHTIEEARQWSYKVDRLTGDVLPKLVDGNDHCWDSVRYALQPLIQGGGGGGFAVGGDMVFTSDGWFS